MLVFFDTTVWLAAIGSPTGLNAKLLDLASIGGPLQGITSDVVLLEFYRHATEGSTGTAYEPDDVQDFVRAHGPLIVNAPLGRHLPQRVDLHNHSIGEIVFELTGKTREDLLADLGEQPGLGDFDPYDLHVLAAAAYGGAQAICSTDKTFVPIGEIQIYTPRQLAAEYGLI